VPSLHGACVSAKHANPAGQVVVHEVDPETEYAPAWQAVQVEAPAAEKVPALHSVATPYPHLEPAEQGLQLLAPASEKVAPTHGLQELESGPENVPAEHRVAIPLSHLDPAGQGLQLTAPLIEYDVPVHVVLIPLTHLEPAGQGLQLLMTWGCPSEKSNYYVVGVGPPVVDVRHKGELDKAGIFGVSTWTMECPGGCLHRNTKGELKKWSVRNSRRCNLHVLLDDPKGVVSFPAKDTGGMISHIRFSNYVYCGCDSGKGCGFISTHVCPCFARAMGLMAENAMVGSEQVGYGVKVLKPKRANWAQ
jgi:hypothetical protein